MQKIDEIRLGERKRTHIIGWKPPDEGGINLNTDGSHLTISGKVVAAGIFRDANASSVKAFIVNLGK